MRLKYLSTSLLALVLLLSACSSILPGGTPPPGKSSDSFLLAYIGPDGNVWVHPGVGGEPKQVTTDATGSEQSNDAGERIAYYFPQISSDGEWVAYRRNIGTPIASGMQYADELWVYDLRAGKGEQVLDQTPGSFAWKPGTDLLAYAPAVPENYFSGNPPEASLAPTVMGLDVDTGDTDELVRPERGYALAGLQWSPDGRYLGFDELVYIEGRGPFGYYDFETSSYVAWEDPIGSYAWHPTGTQIYYDRLTYVATGSEEIYSRSLTSQDEQQLTDYTAKGEYAFYPAVSPGGDRIAYLASLGGPDSQTYALMVQDLAGGEPASLGSFESVLNLGWSPDGSLLLFSAGPWDAQQINAVDAADGTVTVLGPGTMVDVADRVK